MLFSRKSKGGRTPRGKPKVGERPDSTCAQGRLGQRIRDSNNDIEATVTKPTN
jgi:hypothetical protein